MNRISFFGVEGSGIILVTEDCKNGVSAATVAEYAPKRKPEIQPEIDSNPKFNPKEVYAMRFVNGLRVPRQSSEFP